MKKSVLFHLSVLIFFAGCMATNRVESVSTSKMEKNSRVGVIYFSNLSGYPNAGIVVAEAITSLLYSLPIRIVESSRISEAVPEYRIIDLNDPLKLEYAGRKLHLDYIIYGYVEEYGYRSSGYGERSSPVISFSVYIFDVKRKKIVYKGFFHTSSENVAGVGTDPLLLLLKDVTKWFYQDLKEKLF